MQNVGFILYHTGETNGLLPAILSIAKQPDKYKLTIIPVGVSAQNILPKTLKKFCKTPMLINDYLGQNDDYNMHFGAKYVTDIVELLSGCKTVVSGCPAQIQYQVIKSLTKDTKKVIFFDGPSLKKYRKKFLAYADAYIYTDEATYTAAQKDSEQVKLYRARHGDFDTWLTNHHKNLRKKKQICKELAVNPEDKVILWLGGYGDLSAYDSEKKGFAEFLNVLPKQKDKFQLRISIHPGLKHFPPQKTNRIINEYYITQLEDIGYSKKDAQQTITKLDSNSLASLATGVVSVESTAAAQAIYIGTPAKYIYAKQKNLSAGIEIVKSKKRWQEIFNSWLNEHNSSSKYLNETNQLQIPLDTSIEQVITEILGSTDIYGP